MNSQLFVNSVLSRMVLPSYGWDSLTRYPSLQPFLVVTVPSDVTAEGEMASWGVNPGCCVLKAKGVLVGISNGRAVGITSEVAVGANVFVGGRVGGIAAAVWACCSAAWVWTRPNACVWMAPGSWVGAGVAPKLQELRIVEIRISTTSQIDLRNFMIEPPKMVNFIIPVTPVICFLVFGKG